MLVYQKTMFDCYYCIRHFVTWKLWKNASKSSFLYYYNGAQKHEGFVGLKKACSRAKTYAILTSLNYDHFYGRYCWWRQFLWQHRMHICKVQKPCVISAWIAWLIHGFLSVKTWLLIACKTDFYAIILDLNIVFHALMFARYLGRF